MLFHFPSFLFFCHAFEVDVFGNVVGLVQQEIASVFVGRFVCSLQRFLEEENPFPVHGTYLKSVAIDGATIVAQML